MVQAGRVDATVGIWGSLPDWGEHCTAYLPIGNVVQKPGRGALKAQGDFLTRAKRLSSKGRPLVFAARVESVEEYSSIGVDQINSLGGQLSHIHHVTVSRTGVSWAEEASAKELSSRLQRCATLIVDKAAHQSCVSVTWSRSVTLYEPYRRALKDGSKLPAQAGLQLMHDDIGRLSDGASDQVLQLILPNTYQHATDEQRVFATTLLSLCRHELKRVFKPEKFSMTAVIGDAPSIVSSFRNDPALENICAVDTIKSVLAAAKAVPVPEGCSELKIGVKGAGKYCFETSSAKKDSEVAASFLEDAIKNAKSAWLEVRDNDKLSGIASNEKNAIDPVEQPEDLRTPAQPSLSVGLIGDVANGKSTLVRAMTGKKTQAHSAEQQQHGMTINLGFANATIVRCQNSEACRKHAFRPGGFTPSDKDGCEYCGASVDVACTVSFLDCPGHTELMATMLSGASSFDAAILAAASNVPAPSAQVKQHLEALKLLPGFLQRGRLVVAQTKAELLCRQSGSTLSLSPVEALERHAMHTSECLHSTVAKGAPYFPLCAPRGLGLEPLAEWLAILAEARSSVPRARAGRPSSCRLSVLRSFDINRPGTDHGSLEGGVLGGTVSGSGAIRAGEELEIRPGVLLNTTKDTFTVQPLKLRCEGIMTEKTQVRAAAAGGLVALRTTLNPSLCANNRLVGAVVGHPGLLPPVWGPTLYLENVEMVSATTTRFSKGDRIVCHSGSSGVSGVVVRFSSKRKKLEVMIGEPICAFPGSRMALEAKSDGGYFLAARCSLFGGACCAEGVMIDDDESKDTEPGVVPANLLENDNVRRLAFLNELVSSDTDTIQRVSVPKPIVTRDGGAHIVVENFASIAATLRRDSVHLKRFLEKEAGLSCVFAGDNRQALRVQWRTRRDFSELLIKIARRYSSCYVVCHQCKSPRTDLVHKTELTCQHCNAKRFVSKI